MNETSSYPLLPVQNEISSYLPDLGSLCSPSFPSYCDLRASLRTCGVIFDEFFESENVESGCEVELGEFDLGSSQISLQLSNSSSPVSISLFTSSPSSILVYDGVDISIEENVIFSLFDVELSGVG